MTLAPVVDRTEALALRVCKLPRNVAEAVGLHSRDLDDRRDLVIVAEQRLAFAHDLDRFTFVDILLL